MRWISMSSVIPVKTGIHNHSDAVLNVIIGAGLCARPPTDIG